MRVVNTAVSVLILGAALALAAAPATQPIVSVLEPFAETGDSVAAAFSLANPNDPTDPYLIFSRAPSASGLRVIKRSLVSAATTSKDFVAIHDKWCPVNYDCTPLTVVPFKNGTEVCWVADLTAGCADLATGNVTWNKPLVSATAPSALPATSAGLAGPAMLWYQTWTAERKHNSYLIDLASGKMLNQTSLNPDLSGSALATTCVSSKLFVALAKPNGTAVIVGYSPLEPAQSLWAVPLPQSAAASSNLAVGTAANGNTMIVFADGTRVYGVDATLGVLKFNVTYSGTPFSPNQYHPPGATFAGVCGGVIVVLGSCHVYMLSLETGESLSSFAVTTSFSSIWQDFACFRDTHFYVAGGVGPSMAFFGKVNASTAAVTSMVFSGEFEHTIAANWYRPRAWFTDGAGTVFNVLNSVIAYNIQTGRSQWMTTSYDGSKASPPVRAVGTSLYCFVGPNNGLQVQCVDASAPAAAFGRNDTFAFTFGVTNDTVVVGPSAGDGACILDATTLELIVDTAVAAGDSHANSATDSDPGSASNSPEFETETSATPIIATTSTGLEVAIIVATLIAVGSNVDCVRSYDRNSGALLWVHCIPTFVTATPVTSPTAVFVLDTNSTIHAIDITTGTKLWSRVVPSITRTATVCGLPVFDRNFTTVFVTSNDYFVAMSARNGDILWSIMPPDAYQSQQLPPFVVNGDFYGCQVVGDSGPLQCQRYDAVTGRNTSAVASIPNPSSTPQLVEYDGRFFVNTMENTDDVGCAGLYEIDFDNITRSRQVIALPPQPYIYSVDAIFVGITDGLVAFQIETTFTDDSISEYNSTAVQVWRLSDFAFVWGLDSTITVGAVLSTLQPLGNTVFASAEAGVLAVLTTYFLVVYDWHTGAVLSVLAELRHTFAPVFALTAAGNGTLLRASRPVQPPYYLTAYSNLRPVRHDTTPAPPKSSRPPETVTSRPVATTDAPHNSTSAPTETTGAPRAHKHRRH